MTQFAVVDSREAAISKDGHRASSGMIIGCQATVHPPTINITNVAQANNEGCGSGCGGCLAFFVGIAAITLFVGAGWLLGSWIAVAVFGAKEGSTAAVAVGWIFEIIYLLLWALVGWAFWKNRQKIWGNKGAGDDQSTPLSQPGRTITGQTAFTRKPTEAQPPVEREQPTSTHAPSSDPAAPEPPQAQGSTAPFCRQCGSQSREGDKFCSTCGAAL